jgi:hypothetical protein
MSTPTRPGLLIIETPAASGFSASCNEMGTIAHMQEPVRYCYFSYETPSSVHPGPSPFSVPLVPRFGFNNHGHSESSTRGEYFSCCPQT